MDKYIVYPRIHINYYIGIIVAIYRGENDE